MKRLAIFGSSDLAQLIAGLATGLGWDIAGFIDNRAGAGTPVAGRGLTLGGTDAVDSLFAAGQFDALAVGIGYLQFEYRREVFEQFAGRIPFATLIHRSSIVETSATIGEGCVVLPGCTIDAGAELKGNVLLNAGAVVAHHSVVGAHSFVGPAAAIAGKVQIGEGCFIGINATVIDHLTLCAGAKVAGGAVLTRSADRPGWYIGAPATLREV